MAETLFLQSLVVVVVVVVACAGLVFLFAKLGLPAAIVEGLAQPIVRAMFRRA
jgi:hypothetical protein